MGEATFVLTIVGSAMGILIGMGAITITLFIYSQNKFDTITKAFQEETKDFHRRICMIEERRNRILMGERDSSVL